MIEQYPIVTMKKGRTYQNKKVLSVDETLRNVQKLINEKGYVYLIDLDGYKDNEPNFELYKKLKGNFWVDAKPRYAGDVMDILINGADRVTLWMMKDDILTEIRDMSENDIFIRGDNPHQISKAVHTHGFSGIVLNDNQTGSYDIETWKLNMKKNIIEKETS